MFTLSLVTPDKKLVAGKEVEFVSLPGHLGELQILPGHAPLLTTLGAGLVTFKAKGETQIQKAAVGWGYCEVNSDGVIVLAESARMADEIDAKAVGAELKDRESEMINKSLDDKEWQKVNNDVQRLRTELDLATTKA